MLRRVFDIDLVCDVCGDKMHHISHIEKPSTIALVLGHLGLETTPPVVAAARAPPQLDFDLGDELDAEDLHEFEHTA